MSRGIAKSIIKNGRF
jgi:hypothetical protein